MIGKGKSISHTGASIGYGMNQEKDAEIVHVQHLAGDTPKEITDEFKIIQGQNIRCKNNTLSFVISPTIEDGKNLNQKKPKELTLKFIKEMNLKNNQAVAFVHRNKQHIHVHLYVNRIGFDGKAYNDSFIGKRSQLAAQEVAEEMSLTTVKEVQQEKLNKIGRIRNEIKQTHEKVMTEMKPKNFDQYIGYMTQNEVKVIPSINKSNKLQGFRFEYKGHNLKGSEVHRSMSGSKLAIQISKNIEKGILLKKTNAIQLLGKTTELTENLAASIARRAITNVIKKGVGIGYWLNELKEAEPRGILMIKE